MPPRSRASTANDSAAIATGPKAAKRPAPRVITPGYVEELKNYARLLFDAGLNGSKEHKRPETVAAVIEVGRDIGLSPTQAIASIAIVNGRPSIYGDMGLALIRSSGLLESVTETYEGEPGTEGYTAVCVMKRVGVAEARVTRFSVADAIRAKLWGKAGPWTQYPERMLMWRARSWTGRDEFGDVLCGLIFTEEARDIPRQVETETVRTEPLTPNAVRKIEGLEPITTPAPTAEVPPPGPPSGPTTATAGLPEPEEEQPRGRTPITEPQLDELVKLRGLLLTSKGLDPDNPEHTDQIRAAWLEILADFGVESARQLTAGQAAELIETLGEKVDPFSHPPKRGG